MTLKEAGRLGMEVEEPGTPRSTPSEGHGDDGRVTSSDEMREKHAPALQSTYVLTHAPVGRRLRDGWAMMNGEV